MQAIAYVSPDPVSSYQAVIQGQQVTVHVYPERKHSKRVNLTVGTIDGTSWDKVGPIGLKLIEAAQASRKYGLRKAGLKSHGPGRQHSDGYRQAAWNFSDDRSTASRSLAPVMPSFERDRDAVSTNPGWAFIGERKAPSRTKKTKPEAVQVKRQGKWVNLRSIERENDRYHKPLGVLERPYDLEPHLVMQQCIEAWLRRTRQHPHQTLH